jgi:hypothetical protein
MVALTFHLPFAMVMLSAVMWLFTLVALKPQWFKQPTLRLAFWSAVEGILFGLAWAMGKPLIEQIFGFSGMLEGSIAGLGWGAMSFYGKRRFRADLWYVEKKRLEEIFGGR